MNRQIAVTSILAAALMLLAEVPANAQRGGRGGAGGMHGGFSAGHMGGFRGSIGSFRGGFGGFNGGLFGHSVFFNGRSFSSFPFRGRDGFRDNRFFFNRRFFFPRSSFFFGSFGFGSGFGWPGYSYWPDYAYSGYPYYPPYYSGPDVASYAPNPVAGGETTRSLPSERYWLIVLKDDTVLLVADYWLDDSTLNYVTRDGKKSSVDLSKVNMDLTKNLNHERGLEFQLPRAKAEYQPPRRDAYGHQY